MHKTRRYHRLLAVLAAVLLVVCCLPISAFAQEEKVPVALDVHYRMDIRPLNDQTIPLGELPDPSGASLTGRYDWETLYGKMNLPADTKIKDRQSGETELTFSRKEEGQPWKAEMTVELASTIQHPSFRVRFEGVENSQTVGVSFPYRPGRSVDGWNFLQNMAAYKTYQEQGYRITGFTVSGDDHAPYTEADHYGLTDAIAGKTVVVNLAKEDKNRKVDFSLRYLSTDNQIQDTQPATLSYTLDDPATDLWDFVLAQDAYKMYAGKGYQMEDYVVSLAGGDRQISEPGQQAVTTDLQDKTVIVHLVKPVESKVEQVPFRLQFRSKDGNIEDAKDVEVPYDADGNSYDLWRYIESTGAYKGYQAAGYTMKSFVVPHQDGSKSSYTGAGQFTVTPALRGAIVAVELDKPVVSTRKTVDFTVEYKSNDGVLDATKQVSAQYDPEGILTDLWDYLAESGTVKAAVKSGYTFQNYLLDKKTVTTHGVQAVNGDLAGKTIVVSLYKAPVSTKKTVDFTVEYKSNDGVLDATKQVSAQYDPEGILTDLWDYLAESGTVKAAVKSGYTFQNYLLDKKTVTTHGVQAVNGDLAGKTVVVSLYKAPVSTKKTVDFTVEYKSNDGVLDATKQVSAQYDPEGILTDLWDYLAGSGTVKNAVKSGYTFQNYLLDEKTVTTHGVQAVNGDLAGKTIVVNLYKAPISTQKTVDFTVEYKSNDGVLDATKQVSAQYDPESILTDLWDYLAESGTVKNAVKSGYTFQNYLLDKKTVTTHGVQAVNGDLAGKTIVVTLYKAPEEQAKPVPIRLHFQSTDGTIQKDQDVSVPYEPNGEHYDLWDFILGTDSYKTYKEAGYALKSYEVPLPEGNKVFTGPGKFIVTPDNRGAIITVELVKQEMAPTTETVNFTLRFLSEDGKVDLRKEASVSYNANGTGVDAWNYLAGTATLRSYEKEGYHLQDFVVPHPAGDATYTAAGQFTVTPALAGKLVTVHLAMPSAPARYESSYLVHFVDENGKEFLPAATAKMTWTEGQQLNLVAQLKDTLAAIGAKGYTFKTLTAWNSDVPYKGTELVVPGNWELAARCVKNAAPVQPTVTPKPNQPTVTPAPSKPAENKPAPSKPAENKPAQAKPAATAQPAQAKAKPAAAPAKAVVKPATPAANQTKILPQTGLQAQTPVVFGVMLFAALAGAAIYLFALRKKLN